MSSRLSRPTASLFLWGFSVRPRDCRGCGGGPGCRRCEYTGFEGGMIAYHRYVADLVDSTYLKASGLVDTPSMQKLLDFAKTQEEEKAKKHQEFIAGLDKRSGAMRMYRTWKLNDNNELRAMVAGYTWKKGENETLTDGSDAGNNSGFYGFSTIEELMRQEKDWWEKSQSGQRNVDVDCPTFTLSGASAKPSDGHWYVCGTILGYGHAKVSEKGARVQYAVPEYIIEPDGSDPDFGMRVLLVAEKYGMKIVSRDTVEDLKTGFIPWWKGRPTQ